MEQLSDTGEGLDQVQIAEKFIQKVLGFLLQFLLVNARVSLQDVVGSLSNDVLSLCLSGGPPGLPGRPAGVRALPGVGAGVGAVPRAEAGVSGPLQAGMV